MTLEELKQENANTEAETEQAEPQAEPGEVEEDAAEEVETEQGTEGVQDTEEDEANLVDSWMQTDDQASEGSESVPLSAHKKLRQKLKGKLSEKEGENEELRARLNELESKLQSPPASQPQSAKPSRDDFLGEIDPDQAYIDAVLEWRSKEDANKAQLETQKQQEARLLEEREDAVTKHYQRAETWIAENKVDPAVYQKADHSLRLAADNVRPGQGDLVADSIIATLGEGSEKLIMYVGCNDVRRNEFQATLAADPTGLKAMRLLGRYEGQMQNVSTKRSSAPRPAKQANGDVPVTKGNLQKRYEKAANSGDAQKAFNLKREARAQGINTNNW